MEGTFAWCTALEKAPEIPAGVTDMTTTFYGCSALRGELVIHANPKEFSMCLREAAMETELKLTGTSEMLQEILDTRAIFSKVTL